MTRRGRPAGPQVERAPRSAAGARRSGSLRHRRLDPDPGAVLRRVRPQAVGRAGAQHRPVAAGERRVRADARHRRARPPRRGPDAAARGHRRTGRTGPDRARWSWAIRRRCRSRGCRGDGGGRFGAADRDRAPRRARARGRARCLLPARQPGACSCAPGAARRRHSSRCWRRGRERTPRKRRCDCSRSRARRGPLGGGVCFGPAARTRSRPGSRSPPRCCRRTTARSRRAGCSRPLATLVSELTGRRR